MVIINIEGKPWEINLTYNITDDEALDVIAQLDWLPETNNYLGLVVMNRYTPSMFYNYFNTADEALNYIFYRVRKDTTSRYFFMRQMTESETAVRLEKLRYWKLEQTGQIDSN